MAPKFVRRIINRFASDRFFAEKVRILAVAILPLVVLVILGCIFLAVEIDYILILHRKNFYHKRMDLYIALTRRVREETVLRTMGLLDGEEAAVEQTLRENGMSGILNAGRDSSSSSSSSSSTSSVYIPTAAERFARVDAAAFETHQAVNAFLSGAQFTNDNVDAVLAAYTAYTETAAKAIEDAIATNNNNTVLPTAPLNTKALKALAEGRTARLLQAEMDLVTAALLSATRRLYDNSLDRLQSSLRYYLVQALGGAHVTATARLMDMVNPSRDTLAETSVAGGGGITSSSSSSSLNTTTTRRQRSTTRGINSLGIATMELSVLMNLADGLFLQTNSKRNRTVAAVNASLSLAEKQRLEYMDALEASKDPFYLPPIAGGSIARSGDLSKYRNQDEKFVAHSVYELQLALSDYGDGFIPMNNILSWATMFLKNSADVTFRTTPQVAASQNYADIQNGLRSVFDPSLAELKMLSDYLATEMDRPFPSQNRSDSIDRIIFVSVAIAVTLLTIGVQIYLFRKYLKRTKSAREILRAFGGESGNNSNNNLLLASSSVGITGSSSSSSSSASPSAGGGARPITAIYGPILSGLLLDVEVPPPRNDVEWIYFKCAEFMVTHVRPLLPQALFGQLLAASSSSSSTAQSGGGRRSSTNTIAIPPSNSGRSNNNGNNVYADNATLLLNGRPNTATAGGDEEDDQDDCHANADDLLSLPPYPSIASQPMHLEMGSTTCKVSVLTISLRTATTRWTNEGLAMARQRMHTAQRSGGGGGRGGAVVNGNEDDTAMMVVGNGGVTNPLVSRSDAVNETLMLSAVVPPPGGVNTTAFSAAALNTTTTQLNSTFMLNNVSTAATVPIAVNTTMMSTAAAVNNGNNTTTIDAGGTPPSPAADQQQNGAAAAASSPAATISCSLTEEEAYAMGAQVMVEVTAAMHTISAVVNSLGGIVHAVEDGGAVVTCMFGLFNNGSGGSPSGTYSHQNKNNNDKKFSRIFDNGSSDGQSLPRNLPPAQAALAAASLISAQFAKVGLPRHLAVTTGTVIASNTKTNAAHRHITVVGDQIPMGGVMVRLLASHEALQREKRVNANHPNLNMNNNANDVAMMASSGGRNAAAANGHRFDGGGGGMNQPPPPQSNGAAATTTTTPTAALAALCSSIPSFPPSTLPLSDVLVDEATYSEVPRSQQQRACKPIAILSTIGHCGRVTRDGVGSASTLNASAAVATTMAGADGVFTENQNMTSAMALNSSASDPSQQQGGGNGRFNNNNNKATPTPSAGNNNGAAPSASAAAMLSSSSLELDPSPRVIVYTYNTALIGLGGGTTNTASSSSSALPQNQQQTTQQQRQQHTGQQWKVYNEAFNLYRNGLVTLAVEAFTRYLGHYPNDHHAQWMVEKVLAVHLRRRLQTRGM